MSSTLALEMTSNTKQKRVAKNPDALKTRVSAFFPEELKVALQEAADLENRSISNYLQNLVKEDCKQKGITIGEPVKE